MDQVRQLRSGTLPRRAGAQLEVCPKCDHHMRMSARNRLHSLLDEGSLVELGSELEPKDVLKFRDSKKIQKTAPASAQKETGEKDALVVMKGTLYAMPVVAAAFEFSFMGGLDGFRRRRTLCARGGAGAGR